MSEVQFPPLFQGEALTGQADPFERALALAITGTDPGTVIYNLGGERLRAALIFAPEVPLEEAMAILPVCGLGFQAALGTLAPPEVAVHLEWDGRIRVNGAVCGRMRVKASTQDPEATPDWLILGLELSMASRKSNPGKDPDRTWLSEEGCGEITPISFWSAGCAIAFTGSIAGWTTARAPSIPTGAALFRRWVKRWRLTEPPALSSVSMKILVCC